MENLKIKLSYNESNTKLQAVSKLFKLLDNQFGENIFLESNEKRVEINLMYECIGSEDHLVSSASLKLVLRRVFEHQTHILYLLNKLEIFAYSTKNSKFLIEAIIEILIFNRLTSQYSTNNICENILVKIVQAAPDNLIHIQNFYVSSQFQNKNMNILLEILKPLINYIYLGIDSINKQNMQLSITHCFLQDVFIDFDDLKYICKIMRWFNSKSFVNNSLAEVLHLIASAILHKKNISSNIDVDYVVLVILELVIKWKLDSSILFLDVIQLLKQYPNEIRSLNGMLIASCSLLYQFPTLNCFVFQFVECLLKINDERLVLNSIVCSTLILPLLQKYIIPLNIESVNTKTQLSQIFGTLESLIDQSSAFTEEFYEINNYKNSFTNEMLNLISLLSFSDDNKIYWLKNIVSINCDLSDLTYETFCLISALLIRMKNIQLCQLCLEMLQKICNIQKTWSCQILQLIIYKLKSEKDPLITNLLLTTLPNLMISKMCLSQVQSLIQHMFENEKMEGKAIQLACLLWGIHPFTIPFLIHLFSKESSFVSFSFQLARMDAIKKICEMAPENHGEELLHYISAVFNNNNSDASVMCLALQSLYYLCRSEVINLLSTWKIIGTKLLANKNSIVLSELCNLMSLVGQFNFEDIDYQLFKSRILIDLWTLTKHENSKVSLSAFKAFKQFSQEDIECIPFEWIKNDQPDIFSMNEIVQLLINSKLTHISGPECFITQLVKYELEKMPRSISFASNRCEVETLSNVVQRVPSFIQTLLESSQYEDIRGSIYAAELFTFEVELIKDKNGAPISSSILNRSETYLQTFKNLLDMANFDCKDDVYHGCTLFQGFEAFMQRLVSVTLEARQMQIINLRKNRKINLEEEENLKYCAILWTRDKIFDEIKLLKKESITIQVNCLYALHALALVITAHISQMDADTLASANDVHIEHVKHLHWLEFLSKSYLSLLTPNHVDNTRIFHFFKNFSCTNINIKSAALLSLSSIANLLNCLSPIFNQFCDYLTQFLINFNNNDHCKTFQLFGCLSVAYFINGFVIDDISQSKYLTSLISIKKLYTMLESYILNQGNQESGIIFAYSMVVSCACLHGCNLVELSYVSIANKIVDIINKITDKTQQKYINDLLFCLSNIVGCAYLMNQISLESSNEFLEFISKLSKKNDSYQIIGNLLYYLTAANHPKSKDLFTILFNKHVTNSSDQSSIESANFLASSIGMIRIITGISVELNDAFIEKQRMDELMNHLKSQIKLNSSDANFVMLLSTTYHLQIKSQSKRNRMASNYKNLPNSSVIRFLMDYIISFIKEGRKEKVYILESVLRCLTSDSRYALPPFNWATITSPILRMQLGSSVERLVLKLLLNQSKFLNLTAEYLISLLISPLFISFQKITKEYVFENLYIISNLNPVNKVKLFLNKIFGNEDKFNEFSKSLLIGLKEILSKKNTNVEIIQLIYSFLNQILNLYSCDDTMLLKCLSHCSDDVIDKIIGDVWDSKNESTANAKSSKVNDALAFEQNDDIAITADDNNTGLKDFSFDEKKIERRFKAICFLISSKSQSFDLLCQSIEQAALHAQKISKESLYIDCLQSFNVVVNSTNLPHFLDGEHRMRWILDLTSFISNFSKNKNCSEQAFEFLLMIFAISIISFSNHGSILLACFFENNQQKKVSVTFTSIIFNLLPNCLQKLLNLEPWNQIENNIINWISIIYNHPIFINNQMKLSCEDCLRVLTNGKTWEKVTSILIMNNTYIVDSKLLFQN